jgi:hypothetical protein
MWMLKARKLFKSIGFEATTLFYAFRDPATPGKLRVLTVINADVSHQSYRFGARFSRRIWVG